MNGQDDLDPEEVERRKEERLQEFRDAVTSYQNDDGRLTDDESGARASRWLVSLAATLAKPGESPSLLALYRDEHGVTDVAAAVHVARTCGAKPRARQFLAQLAGQQADDVVEAIERLITDVRKADDPAAALVADAATDVSEEGDEEPVPQLFAEDEPVGTQDDGGSR